MLYGRDAERALIGALLGAARESRSGSLVIRGEAGVGKTALLEDARERAEGMNVLAAHGVESESELPFAGLHQLTRPALHLLDRLPVPQAGALRGALGLAESRGDDRFLTSAATLTLLAEVAEERPVLCLVDDVQWLDRASVDALLFVARRLDAEGVVMLFGAREGEVRRFEGRGLADVELGGLDRDAAAALVALGASGDVAPHVREVLVERARGNALALVELPGALSPEQLAGAEPLPEALPLTRGVERLFAERLRRLPAPAQRLLSLIAVDATGRLDALLRAAQAIGIEPSALADVESARLIWVHDSTVELRHPLVRSAIQHGSPAGERRAAHLALADALTGDEDADRRAWHHAAAALGPDAEVAAELERTAERARRRGGHAAAAAALERAAALSPDDESRARRLVAAATAAWRAGRPARSQALLDRADPIASDPRVRAQLEHIRGVIEWRCGDLLDACSTLVSGAAGVAPHDPPKALEMLLDACLAAWDAGDYARIAEVGRLGGSLPGGEDARRRSLTDLLIGVGVVSQGGDPAPLVRDTQRAAGFDEPRLLVVAALGATVAGESAIPTALLKRAAALARSSGAVDVLTLVLEGMGVEGFLAGERTAAADAAEGLRLAEETGLPNAATLHRASLAWLAAVQGRDDECRAYAAEVDGRARANGTALAHSIAQWGLALLDLGAGRPEEVIPRLVALRDAPPGTGHPLYVLLSAADLVEACIRCDRGDDARAAYAVLEAFARPGAPPWALALAARCRGLLADGATAERELDEALRLHAEAGRAFDRARTELIAGELLRRRRRRVAARERLRAAQEAFEALGATPWAERARAELRASGETARRRDPGTLAELTPQELQVARFVADGLSNKEVAAQLFLSPRTIDAHLRSVFSKLGITSRTQLARIALDGDEAARGAALA